MIFLSAQPDQYYFTWQLALQIFNFTKLGIPKQDIHILIGFNPDKGPNPSFSELIEECSSYATFFLYPDTRKHKMYASSIRPHIIHKHFVAFPNLQEEVIFYHDSDIIFRELPNFKLLSKGKTWYVSDTRSYLDSCYIKQFLDDNSFAQMCDIVGVRPVDVIKNDKNCGGAQYLLKSVKSHFWKKLESDCEKMYVFLDKFNYLSQNNSSSKKISSSKIQAWCTDMWCLLWNAITTNVKIKHSIELEFCWVTSNISEWEQKKILHYTGNVRRGTSNFRKTDFINYPPFFDNRLKKIKKDVAGYILKNLITDYNISKERSRINLSDVSFIVILDNPSKSNLNNLRLMVHHLFKNFNTDDAISYKSYFCNSAFIYSFFFIKIQMN